ncbi:MAG: DUF2577 family protein [Defluviitaleaceae bacterium]|nr:DUF2577 family protein [Defluviitaleaceae bacterium]
METNADRIIQTIYKIAQHCSDKGQSQILYGTVTDINPLYILIDGDQEPMPESFFYLSPMVKVRKEHLRLRRIVGKPDKITMDIVSEAYTMSLKNAENQHTLNADTITKTLNALEYSENVAALEGTWKAETANPPADIGVSGEGYTRVEKFEKGSISENIDQANKTASYEQLVTTEDMTEKAKSEVYEENDLEVKIIEEPFKDETHKDHNMHDDLKGGDIHFTDTESEDSALYDQTTIIEVIAGRGLKVGDIVLLTSHNHNQRYLVHDVINREPL